MLCRGWVAFNESLARSLVLNASYEPIKVIHWQKALILWIQDKVEVLEFHTVEVRSPSRRFRLPSVMRLKSYIRPRRIHPIKFSRENVYLRDDYTCQYCAQRFPFRELTLDHVVPASKQGPTNWTNVVTACRPCNHRKANRTPATAKMPLLTTPRAPDWLPSHPFDLDLDRVPPSWRDYLPTG